MTDEKRTINRADLDPGACPNCGNVNIEGKSIDIEGPEARQEVSCSDCGTFWHDVYQLQRRHVYETDGKGYTLTIEDGPPQGQAQLEAGHLGRLTDALTELQGVQFETGEDWLAAELSPPIKALIIACDLIKRRATRKQ